MGHYSGHDASLRALVYELKQPLIHIARQAELKDLNQLESIQQVAEQTLKTIDSYLLSAQTEYGQKALDLAPINASSVLYDVSMQLRRQALSQGVTLTLDSRTTEPVMTHRLALSSIVSAFGSMLLGANQSELILRSYKMRNGAIGVGIFTEEIISTADLKTALELKGRAHMPLSRLTSSSHVSLSIADDLCRAIGGVLKIKKMGKLSGFVAELPPSEQLSLV